MTVIDLFATANTVGVAWVDINRSGDVIICLNDNRKIRITGAYDPELWVGWDDE